MKVSIFEESVEAEREYKLKLFSIGNNIVVALADENGKRINSSSLVAITPDMELVRCCNINGSLGFSLVSKSRLKMIGEVD